MPTLAAVIAALEHLAPLRLAAEWDAVGLLVGSRRTEIDRVLCCLSLTPDVAAEAVAARADLVVTHHPLPFRPVARLTDETITGRVLLDLTGAGIAVYSPHTAWDSAAGGINDQLATLAGLEHVAPLVADAIHPAAGCGRAGTAATTVGRLARHLAARLAARGVQIVGPEDRPAGRVGIVCGSGGDMLAQVKAAGCSTFLTGEIWLHQALEAKEHVQVQPENVTLASITFQNYFRLYSKLAGMTGTAATEADEFAEIYKLDVVEIPTNRPVSRTDEDDDV